MHYLDEMENIYNILCQIYSGQ